jgi:hypothetical protein
VYCDTGGVFFQDKTVSLSGRKRPETNGRLALSSPRQRMWDSQMQFIFDLIWSCGNYFAEIGQQEAQP